MKRPASLLPPGKPFEVRRKAYPRLMVTHDKTRLIACSQVFCLLACHTLHQGTHWTSFTLTAAISRTRSFAISAMCFCHVSASSLNSGLPERLSAKRNSVSSVFASFNLPSTWTWVGSTGDPIANKVPQFVSLLDLSS